jgi:hypothetical protein
MTKAPSGSEFMANEKENPVFWMMAAILAFLWLLGLVCSPTMGGHSPSAGGRPDRGAPRDRWRATTRASSGSPAVHTSSQSSTTGEMLEGIFKEQDACEEDRENVDRIDQMGVRTFLATPARE